MEANYLAFGSIVLRPLEPDDIDILYSWENNTAIWEVSNTKAPFSKHILAQYIQESFKDIYSTKQLRLVIENLEGKPVGAIDLFDFEPFHQRAGVGVLINSEEDRGKGYASDALQALCNYGLNVLGLHQLYANITADNESSLILFQKLGFEEVGIKKEWIRSLTEWKDEVMLQKFL